MKLFCHKQAKFSFFFFHLFLKSTTDYANSHLFFTGKLQKFVFFSPLISKMPNILCNLLHKFKIILYDKGKTHTFFYDLFPKHIICFTTDCVNSMLFQSKTPKLGLYCDKLTKLVFCFMNFRHIRCKLANAFNI